MGLELGSRGSPVSNVHFVGDLIEAHNQPPPYSAWDLAITAYCSSNCTFDYVTVKPEGLTVPDLPVPGHGLTLNGQPTGHGVTYSKGYGITCGCGIGNFSTVGHGVSFKNADIWGAGSEIIYGPNSVSTPNLVQDSWLHDQADCNADNNCSEHADGIGMVDTNSSSSYDTLNHNNMPFIRDNTNDIAFQTGSYNHLTLTNNVFAGDGGAGTVDINTGTNITFTGNLITNYTQQNGPFLDNFPTTDPNSSWAHNKFAWDPTGMNPLWQNGNQGAAPFGVQYTNSQAGMCWVPTGGTYGELSNTDFGGGAC